MTPQEQAKLAQIIKDYGTGLANDPRTASYAQNNGAEQFVTAYMNNDFSNMVGPTGKPFSFQDQQAAEAKGWADIEGYYKAQKDYETKATERALAQKQADYQDYLLKSGQQFSADKTKLDQTAAEQGVLFSGGRTQRESDLKRQYEQEQASKLGTYGRDITGTAEDFAYKYGSGAAKGLNQYYKAGGNVYNPNVATGGVGSSGLSSIYKPSSSNYQGTELNKFKAEAQKRAATSLSNKGYKLLGAYSL